MYTLFRLPSLRAVISLLLISTLDVHHFLSNNGDVPRYMYFVIRKRTKLPDDHVVFLAQVKWQGTLKRMKESFNNHFLLETGNSR